MIFVPINAEGSGDQQKIAAGEPEVFAEGWLNDSTNEYIGRPVAVAALPDGSLLVSDDLAGAIYRISYKEQTES